MKTDLDGIVMTIVKTISEINYTKIRADAGRKELRQQSKETRCRQAETRAENQIQQRRYAKRINKNKQTIE